MKVDLIRTSNDNRSVCYTLRQNQECAKNHQNANISQMESPHRLTMPLLDHLVQHLGVRNACP